MKHEIKDTATYVMVMTAAIIGAVLMLTVIAAVAHHPAATPQPSQTSMAVTHVVVCDSYLSLGAMRSANAANIPEAASFCVVPNAEA